MNDEELRDRADYEREILDLRDELKLALEDAEYWKEHHHKVLKRLNKAKEGSTNYDRQIEDLHDQLSEARANAAFWIERHGEQTRFIEFLDETLHCAVRAGHEQSAIFKLLVELVARQVQRNDMQF